MKTLAVLGIVLAGLQVQAGFALEPDEAGRQAREDLDALMEKQRQNRDAKSEPEPAPSSSAARNRHRPPKSIENEIPAICSGC